jgi:hypothetical protein
MALAFHECIRHSRNKAAKTLGIAAQPQKPQRGTPSANPCTALHFLFYCFPYIDWPGEPDERASAQTPPQIPASYNFLVGTRLDQPPNIASGTVSLHLLQPQLSGFALHSTMSSSCICEVEFPTIRCESSFFRPGATATNV